MPWSDKLARFKHFLRQVWHLSAPYFSTSAEKWKARGLLAAIVALNLGAVYMLVLLNEWNRTFYDALQNKNAAVFWTQLGRFTYLAMPLRPPDLALVFEALLRQQKAPEPPVRLAFADDGEAWGIECRAVRRGRRLLAAAWNTTSTPSIAARN